MISQVAISGEARRGLPEEFQAYYASVPWADLIAMRNILVRQYFGVDEEAVWLVVERDIPELKQNIQGILADLDKSIF